MTLRFCWFLLLNVYFSESSPSRPLLFASLMTESFQYYEYFAPSTRQRFWSLEFTSWHHDWGANPAVFSISPYLRAHPRVTDHECRMLHWWFMVSHYSCTRRTNAHHSPKQIQKCSFVIYYIIISVLIHLNMPSCFVFMFTSTFIFLLKSTGFAAWVSYFACVKETNPKESAYLWCWTNSLLCAVGSRN